MPASWPGCGYHKPLDVPPRQDHRGVEPDYVEAPGDVEDLSDDGLAHVGVHVVELGGVIPGEAGAVVTMVDVAFFAADAASVRLKTTAASDESQ